MMRLSCRTWKHYGTVANSHSCHQLLVPKNYTFSSQLLQIKPTPSHINRSPLSPTTGYTRTCPSRLNTASDHPQQQQPLQQTNVRHTPTFLQQLPSTPRIRTTTSLPPPNPPPHARPHALAPLHLTLSQPRSPTRRSGSACPAEWVRVPRRPGPSQPGRDRRRMPACPTGGTAPCMQLRKLLVLGGGAFCW